MFPLPAVNGDEEEEDGEGVVEETQDVDAVETLREDEEGDDVWRCLFTTMAETDEWSGLSYNQQFFFFACRNWFFLNYYSSLTIAQQYDRQRG